MKHLVLLSSLLCFHLFMSLGQNIKGVYKLSELPDTKNESIFVYSLPQTTIAVKVRVLKKLHLPGPYSAFAEELLGLKKVVSEESVEWKIDQVEMTSFDETDPHELFALVTDKNFRQDHLLGFAKQAIIYYPAAKIYTQDSPTFQIINKRNSHDPVLLTSIKDKEIQQPNINEIAKKSLTQVKTEKELVDQAREAAEKLKEIQDRKKELIVEEDPLPEANSLKLVLSELNKLEDNTMALFSGWKEYETYEYWFFYTPKKEEEHINTELFRFSSESGIIYKDSQKAAPVFLKIDKSDYLRNIREQRPSKQFKNSILYKIPDRAIFRLMYQDNLLAEKTIPVYQFGVYVNAIIN